jgi:hypothetical protein
MDMDCQKCGQAIEPGEERERNDKILCEDCYIEAMSPVRGCDPWAVHSAKRLEQMGGGGQLTDIQQKIMDLLKKTGGIKPELACQKLDITYPELEREFAALRHMEKVRGEKVDGQVIIRLW